MKSHSRLTKYHHNDALIVSTNAMAVNAKRAAVGLACLLLSLSAAKAAPLSLSQGPPSNGGSEPRPNVILTIDDSGSMSSNVSSTDSTDKIVSLKNALKAQFVTTPLKVPDNRIRLAWQAMHDNGGGSSHPAKTLTLGATNSMKVLDATRRTTFTTWINSLSANNYTPSHDMMKNVYTYMRSPAGINSPWADVPGVAQDSATYLACRRTYHIFMTDGEWNGVNGDEPTTNSGNIDGTARTLPDGTAYTPNTACTYANRTQTCVYADAYGGASNKADTLADLAFKNWATDLQDGSSSTANMSNSVRYRPKKTGAEVIANPVSSHTSFSLPEYWNPKNDPATWQHVTQYTIGFGADATSWSGNPDWDDTTDNNYGGGYPKLANGEIKWQNVIDTSNTRTSELWHMALNGRGKYYPARSAAALTAAFSDILDNIIADTSQPLVSVTTSSSYLRSGMSAFIAGYSADKWGGLLKARAIDPTTGNVAATDTWNAGINMDDAGYSVTNRFVLSANNDVGFSWKTYSGTAPILPTAQQLKMNSSSSIASVPDGNGQARVNYIRGDRTQEVQNGGIFRDRNSRFGDVVNSNIWYTGIPASGYTTNGYSTFRSTNPARTTMLYVGANDGMLHGVAAATNGTVAGGTELLAYIPQGIAEGKLRDLTDTTYTHKYFVDGSPFSGDAYLNATWTTVLVGTLGNGGKGYFILDATDPANFTVGNATNLVIKDTTATTDPDIGYISSPPTADPTIFAKSGQIVKLNEKLSGTNRWALVMGNGYNSTNEAPVLLIQYLDGTKSIRKITPCGGQTVQTSGCTFQGNGNGLSSPLLVDLSGDGTVDVAYAGDLQGNLWKFNLSSATETAWNVSFSGQPFFVAKGPASLGTRSSGTLVQPIGTAPYWMPHPLGGIMVSVGSGKNLTDTDQTSTNVDSYYALWDNSPFTVAASGIVTITDSSTINTTGATASMSKLVQQTINASPIVDSGTNYYTSSSNAVTYTTSDAGTTIPTVIAATKRGWFLDWSTSGQRVLTNTRLFSGPQIMVQTTIPKSGSSSSGESCTASATAERSFLSILDMFQGTPPTVNPFIPGITYPLITTIEVDSDTTPVQTSPTNIKIIKATDGGGGGGGNLKVGAHLGKRVNWRNKQ